jgi:hypothetical protein
MSDSRPAVREQRIATEFIDRLALDLSGLTVLTEAASGPYLATPLAATLAGADRVLAVTADSRYASGEEVAQETRRRAREWGVADRLEIGAGRSLEWFAEADVVTNSGFVRPIDAEAVRVMKPTAVIPLMWETWEYRSGDLDLDACREKGVLVLGTRETVAPCDMRPYFGFLALKLLFELGLEGAGTKVLLLGGNELVAAPITEFLSRVGMEVSWFASEGDAQPYEELSGRPASDLRDYDALLVTEHSDPRQLVGPDGVLSPAELASGAPDLRVGVIGGNVDAEALRASGLRFLPERLNPFPYESYGAATLGPRPVLELYCAGLKVGEAMARARLDGASAEEAASRALDSSPAMDFQGELAWT